MDAMVASFSCFLLLECVRGASLKPKGRAPSGRSRAHRARGGGLRSARREGGARTAACLCLSLRGWTKTALSVTRARPPYREQRARAVPPRHRALFLAARARPSWSASSSRLRLGVRWLRVRGPRGVPGARRGDDTRKYQTATPCGRIRSWHSAGQLLFLEHHQYVQKTVQKAWFLVVSKKKAWYLVPCQKLLEEKKTFPRTVVLFFFCFHIN